MVDINVNEKPNKLGVFPYVIAAISFIPGIGVIFGIIAVIWGVLTKKVVVKYSRLLVLVGLALVLFFMVRSFTLVLFRGEVYMMNCALNQVK